MRCLAGIVATLSCFAVTTSILNAQDNQESGANFQPADVQIEASRVYVFVEKTGLGHQHGVEARLLKSTLSLGASQDAGKLVFDMNSFDADTEAARKYVGLTGTTDENTRMAVNENMKGTAVLAVDRYPTATFDVKSAKATGQSTAKGLPLYELNGTFTLHGKARPLSFVAEVEQTRGWLHVKGAFSIKQTDYGIKPYSKILGAVGVADELRIYGDLYVAPTQHVILQNIPKRP